MTETTSKADLHLHTTWSDGTASISQVLARAAQAELRVIAITDHDTVTGAVEARRLARDFGVEVIVGEEVSTCEGHLLALFIETPVPPQRPAAETIAAVHAQGGLCVAPHPFDWAVPSLGKAGLYGRCVRRGGESRRDTWRLDAIEGFNASITWPRSTRNVMAQRFASEVGLPAVGGSDAHTLATVGRGYTLFPGTSPDDLYRAIQRGRVTWGGACMTIAHQLEYCWLSFEQSFLRGHLAPSPASAALLSTATTPSELHTSARGEL